MSRYRFVCLFLLLAFRQAAAWVEVGNVLSLGLNTYDPPVENFREMYSDPNASYTHNRMYVAFRRELAGPVWWGLHYFRYGAETDPVPPFDYYSGRLTLDYFGGTIFAKYPWTPKYRVMAYVGVGYDVAHKGDRIRTLRGIAKHPAYNYKKSEAVWGPHFIVGCTLRVWRRWWVDLNYMRLSAQSSTQVDAPYFPHEGKLSDSMLFFGIAGMVGTK